MCAAIMLEENPRDESAAIWQAAVVTHAKSQSVSFGLALSEAEREWSALMERRRALPKGLTSLEPSYSCSM